MAGLVGESPGLGQQRLPLFGRETVAVPVGARVFAAVVEEPDVVVGLLEGTDRQVDEAVELVQIIGDVGGYLEIHDPDRR